MASNVPKLTITADGVAVPETQDVLNGVLNDFNDAFGGNLNITSVSTPQSILSADLTQAITETNSNLAYYFNGVDPDKAEGRLQDAIARIYFLYRKPATATKVVAECTGTPNAVLPAGSIAEDTITGLQYATKIDYVFGAGGTVDADFYCLTLGTVSCAIGALTKIPKYVADWDAVTNNDVGELGEEVENRTAFELRRKQSVAKNSHGSVESIFGEVAAVAGVTDVFTVDNPTGQTVLYGATNYSLKPHSILVSVTGGENNDIARAIFNKKDAGCDYNGNTTVQITDTATFSSFPPTYNVTFLRPTEIPVYFKVDIFQNEYLPLGVEQQIRKAIIKAFYGQDEGDRARIGSALYSSRFIQGVVTLGSYILLSNIYLGRAASPTGNHINFGVDEVPTLNENNIAVNIITT